jgi:hypothetical protein
MIPKIEYMDHKQGVESTVGFFPGIEPDSNLHKASAGWIRAVAMVKE